MTSLEKFKKTVKPRKRVSRLNQYESEIRELLSDRYTHQQICEYLQQTYNVEVSRQYLSSYIQISMRAKTSNKVHHEASKQSPKSTNSAKDLVKELDNFFEPTA